MSSGIGLIFDSDEWSNREIIRFINKKNVLCDAIPAETVCLPADRSANYKMFVNRVFSSAPFRGKQSSISLMESFYSWSPVPVFPDYGSFRYDVDKLSVLADLKKHGINVPDSIAVDGVNIKKAALEWNHFPCIIKPNCGGRSFNVHIIKNREELNGLTGKFTNQHNFYIIQEYIPLPENYTIRTELIGGEKLFTLKRYTGSENISSYSRGSKLELYNNCPSSLMEFSRNILQVLNIPLAGLDIIETKKDKYVVIDVNVSTNFTEDYIKLVGFNPLEPVADMIIRKYRDIT